MGLIRNLAFLLLAGIILISCGGKKESPLLKEEITHENLDELAQKMQDDENLTTEEVSNFMTGLQRMNNDSIVGRTVGEVIDRNIEFVNKATLQNALAIAKRKMLAVNHGFNFHGLMKDTTADGKLMFKLNYTVINKSEKILTGIKGRIEYRNNANQIVKAHIIEVNDMNITGKSQQSLSSQFPYNSENNRDQIVWNQGKALAPIWVPQQLNFSDGSVVTILDEQQQQM